jgi:hypothetical protein
MDIVFSGSEADDHEIEAYTGIVSLEGIARAANIAAHYAATGQVRFRAPYSDEIEFRLSAPAEGSLAFPFKVVSRISSSVTKKRFAAALFLALLARSTGQEFPSDIENTVSEVRPGDLDAMAEGATPGILRAHRWIDNSEKSINIADALFSDVVFDEDTRDYLEIEEYEDETTQDVTVAAVNANSRIGRVYFEDLGRTVPFKVGKEATGRTLSNLSRYLTRHIEKTNEWVSIRYIPVRYSDNRLKRIIILDCALASELE